MNPHDPKVPGNLNPFARELLESLSGNDEAAEIVIGGGVALSHYLEHRDTVDLDAWWRQAPSLAVLAFVEMPLDHSVYPDLADPPEELPSPEDKADYMQRICAAFDFGIFPEESDWRRFAEWKDVFDRYPIRDSPAYHTFRHWFGWEPVEPTRRLGIPSWKAADLQEGRTDPCEDLV